MAGVFMAAFAALLAIPAVLAACGGSKFIASLIILREVSGRYRAGEGRMSQHYDITITEGVDPMGNDIYEIAQFFPKELGRFVGCSFQLTDSEFQSLAGILTMIRRMPVYRKLQHQGQDTLDLVEQAEIRRAIVVLEDALHHHDEGRVWQAAGGG